MAVVVTDADGAILEMNSEARALLGEETAEIKAWDLFRSIPGGKDLPCYHGCSCDIVGGGAEGLTAKRVFLRGRCFQLRCVPVGDKVVTTLTKASSDDTPAEVTLTDREVDVLKLLASGLTTQESAAMLGVGEASVRTYVQRMRAKLNVHTRAALVARGFMLGYLSAPGG